MAVDVPRVSIVIPVHNGAALLRDAVESVLSQTLCEFELIVLDDGSTDGTWAVCQAFTDPRIRVFRHDNMGVAATMNRGVALARAKYFARLDHDDLMLPEKLKTQYDFLEKHADVAMVGTWANIHSAENAPTGRAHLHLTSCDAIRLFLLFDNPFVQSSMMIRLADLQEIGGYCEDRSREPDDYELLSRVARHYVAVNLPAILTIYRETANSLSRSPENPLLPKVMRLSAENLYLTLKPNYSLNDCTRLAHLYHHGAGTSLPVLKVVRMMSLAETRIAAGRLMSDEFQSEAKRLRRFMVSRAIYYRYLVPFRGFASRVKRMLFAKMGA